MSINAEWVRDEIQALQADNAALRKRLGEAEVALAVIAGMAVSVPGAAIYAMETACNYFAMPAAIDAARAEGGK
jgi:cytochrome c-type biogenesis protein CcmE